MTAADPTAWMACHKRDPPAAGSVARRTGGNAMRRRVAVLCSDLWPTAVDGTPVLAADEAVILEGSGHFLMQERPEVVARFLVETAMRLAKPSGGPRL